jgi:murein DD-endopeptidase MepM/ murein hydrolase activator NlpD
MPDASSGSTDSMIAPSIAATIDPALISTVTAATARLSAAQAKLDAATRDYKVARAGYDHAKALARAADKRADDAEAAATASAAQLLLKLRGTHGQTPGGTSGQILFDPSSGNLLQKLSTLHQLDQVSATTQQLSERARHDAARATAARTAADRAQKVVQAVPLDAARTAMHDAQAAVDAAQAAVDAAQAALDSAQASDGVSWMGMDVPDFSELLDGSAWVDPVRGPITDVFGPRPSRPLGTALFHPGDDIGAACGTWIVAASSGTVVDTGPYSGYGNWVVIDHGDGVQTVYGHIMDGGTAVDVGEHVETGQPIARVGSTGLSTGCHLHLEVRVNGEQIDPQPFFAARSVIVGG